MIYSPTKESEKEWLATTYRWMKKVLIMYEKSGDEKYFTHFKEQEEFAERLKKKIETHDYTPEDEQHYRVDDIIKKHNSLQPTHNNPI